MKRTNWRKAVNYLVLAAALIALPVSSATATHSQDRRSSNSVDNWQDWQPVGEAQLSFLFFDVYQSTLLTPSGTYQQSSDVTPHPLALSIEYQRSISQQQLLDATLEQWDKLGFAKQDSSAWIKKLALIFPDIKSGQKLIYITNGSSGYFVYSPQPNLMREIGAIVDEPLNDAFLSIWLSPKTEYSDLRKKLIGMKR